MKEITTDMKCINPGEVEDSDISAFASGTGRPEFGEHLAKCQFCQQETAEYQALTALFDKGLGRKKAANRAECPDTEIIAQYVLDLLSTGEKHQVKAHLKGCNYCLNEFNLLEADKKENLLPGAAQTVSSIPTMAANLRESLRRVIATVTQPKAQTQFALRSSTRLNRFQHYEAEDVTVTLELDRPNQYKEAAWQVKGLVLRDDALDQPDEIQVEMFQDDQLIASELLDELGSFSFDRVADPDKISINIRFNDKIVVVPPGNSPDSGS